MKRIERGIVSLADLLKKREPRPTPGELTQQVLRNSDEAKLLNNKYNELLKKDPNVRFEESTDFSDPLQPSYLDLMWDRDHITYDTAKYRMVRLRAISSGELRVFFSHDSKNRLIDVDDVTEPDTSEFAVASSQYNTRSPEGRIQFAVELAQPIPFSGTSDSTAISPRE